MDFERWQRDYKDNYGDMLIDPQCIGINMIGRVINVKGHISDDMEEEVRGMVLSTTASDWCGVTAALFLVMYEDGKVHWEDLTNEQTKHPWSFSK